MDSILKKVYYTPSSASSFGGVMAVYREAKKQFPSLTIAQTKQWLSKQYTYTMHKPARRRFQRNKVYVKGMNEQFQIDLADMVSIQKQNDGYKYLLTCIDVFCKFAWAVPVKNKTGEEITRAFKTIVKERKPRKVQSDQGKEFLNKNFQQLLANNDIIFFTSKNQEIKCSIVERFNRTIKSKIWKYFSSSRTFRYIDVLQKLVDAYNSAYHRSIKMRPKDVNKENSYVVRKNLYGNLKADKKPKFRIGDKVRVSKMKKLFDKGYLPNWSEEVFFIKQILPRKPIVYILVDYGGEIVDGLWYEKELQPVIVDKYWIEKVIKRNKSKALVKWLGYPEKFNSWIPVKDLKNG